MSIIRVKGLSKVFKLYSKPLDRVREALSPFGKPRHQDFYALNDVNLEINAGECIGLIGMNGSGKSTLLQVIAGILSPSKGEVVVRGVISALLELGAGFNPELTGAENIDFQFSIMGVPSSQFKMRREMVLEFADIGDFINQPVKTYSSGMYVRLAFAVAINVDPDILIVDEALAVGDSFFQAKCMKKIREFRESGKTLLFVSHDPGAVKTLCDRAYLLHRGRIVDEGAPDQVFNHYNSLIAVKEREKGGISEGGKALKEAFKKRSGNQKITILDVKMQNSFGQGMTSFVSGETVAVQLILKFNDSISDPTIGILIRDRLGNDIFGINNHLMKIKSGHYERGSTVEVVFRLPLNLGPNIYSLTVAAHSEETHVHDSFDWINDALIFTVVHSADLSFSGTARLTPQFQIHVQK